MDDLQRAIAWLEEMKALAEQTIEESKKLPYAVNNIRHYKRIANCRALLDALRKEPVEIVLDHEGLKARPLDALRWVPVTERLPRDGELCLCVKPRGKYGCSAVVIAQHQGDGRWSSIGLGGVSITHWRPLPAPPEGSE